MPCKTPKAGKISSTLSPGEELLALHLNAYKIPFQRQYNWMEGRKFRADFFIEPTLLIEVEGGSWAYGRHNRGDGYQKDLQKQNYAVLLGYDVLRFTTDMVTRGEAIDCIQSYLFARKQKQLALSASESLPVTDGDVRNAAVASLMP